jgi:hypothetical protein
MPVDVNAALKLKVDNGLSYSQIGAIQGYTKQAIHKAIKPLLPPASNEYYKTHRADILSGLQAKLLAQVDDARLKKAPAGSLVLAACQLYDKERLERGQSTANISVHDDLKILREMEEIESWL